MVSLSFMLEKKILQGVDHSVLLIGIQIGCDVLSFVFLAGTGSEILIVSFSSERSRTSSVASLFTFQDPLSSAGKLDGKKVFAALE